MSAIRVLCSLLFTFICLWGSIIPIVSSTTAVLSVEASTTQQEHPEQSENDHKEGELIEEVCLEDALPVVETSWLILNSKPPVPQLLAVGAFSEFSVETPPPEKV